MYRRPDPMRAGAISGAARTDGFRLNSAAVIAATRDVCVANTDN